MADLFDEGCSFVALFVSEQWYALLLLWICQERELYLIVTSVSDWEGSKSYATAGS